MGGAARLAGKATRALRDALRRPEDSLWSKRFWEDPGTTRLFDVERMMQGKRVWTKEGGEDGQFDEDDEDLPEEDAILVRHVMGINWGSVEDVLSSMFHKEGRASEGRVPEWEGQLRFGATELLESSLTSKMRGQAVWAQNASVAQIMEDRTASGVRRRIRGWDPDARVRRIRRGFGYREEAKSEEKR